MKRPLCVIIIFMFQSLLAFGEQGGQNNNWVDPVLTPGVTVIRAQHFLEIRQRVDSLNSSCGFSAQTWQSPLYPRYSVIKKNDIEELRTAVRKLASDYNSYLVQAGEQPQREPTFEDSQIIAGVTRVKAIHLSELRNAVDAIGPCGPIGSCRYITKIVFEAGGFPVVQCCAAEPGSSVPILPTKQIFNNGTEITIAGYACGAGQTNGEIVLKCNNGRMEQQSKRCENGPPR